MSDRAAFVTALILDRPLCIRCLATKSGLVLADLDAVIGNIERALRLNRVMDRCRACGVIDTVLSLDHPK